MAEEKNTVKKTLTKRQKKNRRNLILAGILLVALIAIAVLVKTVFVDDNENTDVTQYYSVMDMSADKVAKIEIHNSYGDLAFRYDADDALWYENEDADFPVEQNILSQLAAKVEELTSTKRIEASDERLQEYGLSDSDLTVTFYDKNNRKETFYIGKYNSVTGTYYLYNTAKDYIYTVDDTFSTIFDMDLYSFAEVDTFPVLDSSSFVSVEKATGDNAYYLEYIKEGIEDNMMDSMTWYFGKPFKEMHACIESKTTDLFEQFVSLTFDKLADYHASGDELANYGLDDPEKLYFYYFTSSGTNDTGEETYNSHILELNVGSEDESGSYYYVSYAIITNGLVSVDNQKVSLMQKSYLDWLLNLDPVDYVYTNIFYAELQYMDTIDLTYKGETYNYTIERDETMTEIASNGKETLAVEAFKFFNGAKEEISSENFRDAYQTLVSLKGLEILSEDRVKEGEAEISWTIQQDKKLDTIVVELVPFNASSYQVRVNGVTDYLVSKQEAIDAVESFLSLTGARN